MPDKDWKALEENLELRLHSRESGIMLTVLQVNTLKLMYHKWLEGKQAKWWIAATGVSLMDQSEAFLKYIEKCGSGSSRGSIGGRGGGSARGGNYQKKSDIKKASVNVAPVAAPAAAPLKQPQQRYSQQNQPFRPCKMQGKGCKESHMTEKMLAELQGERMCLYCFRHRMEQDCFAKGNPSYRGGEENGCS